MHEGGQQQDSTEQPRSISRGDATTGKPRPPANVRIAFLIWIGLSIIWILPLVMAWSTPGLPSYRPQILEEWRDWEIAYNIGSYIAVLLPLIIPVAIAIAAIKMRTGSNRSRIALMVIGIVLALPILVIIVGTLLSSSASIGGFGMVELLINLVLLALLTSAITLMFRPRVSGFFR